MARPIVYRHGTPGTLFLEDLVPITNAVSTSFSIQSFTSSEPGAWSNSYLIAGKSEAILFDVSMLHSDAKQIADGITKSGKTPKTVVISHAHPDHFMGLDVITERFPKVRLVCIYRHHN
jgi:glyoxylase-like metal-dependent hydrolase (beta-lactamase superfamily II)